MPRRVALTGALAAVTALSFALAEANDSSPRLIRTDTVEAFFLDQIPVPVGGGAVVATFVVTCSRWDAPDGRIEFCASTPTDTVTMPDPLEGTP